ncbi:MAG: hypothetical protein UW81_C0025G0011, partial [Candidatus Giovannonibacteria bacterium GW2011_GWC2_44_9]
SYVQNFARAPLAGGSEKIYPGILRDSNPCSRDSGIMQFNIHSAFLKCAVFLN